MKKNDEPVQAEMVYGLISCRAFPFNFSKGSLIHKAVHAPAEGKLDEVLAQRHIDNLLMREPGLEPLPFQS